MWYGGHLLYSYTKGESVGISPGVLTSFLIYGLQIGMAFGVISSLFGDFMQAVGASFRIFELLDRRPIIPVKGGRMLISPEGSMASFKSFIPECPVLNGISLTLIPDKVIALVGPSGGGKSTIATLIERFYDPDSGAVLFDDEDIRELDPINLRQQIARVEQEPVLFACSIYENICYGRDASLEEVKAIAKEANAHEFVETFEQGYETLVGERGVRLSGGQKQRVAIARALLTDPKVLLLDEATSALDAESEHLVQEAIERAMKGRSVLVIAHRLSTVKNADAVLVIDQGKIVEMGTHKQLLDMDGMYKKLVLRQLSISGTEDSIDE
ncbi:ABC transporter B family member 1-like isoform X2 [Centruroides sculpturatus]|uniref:ABC transporter B family member 1-like isoform X2 n=1 Tax=Centruroides sculpturatus TaxID=218467 RepID=UPI000C6E8234|nr:ABC transporter B family member 1-like isoform X2 [Centruroides sculpturatus]